MDTKATDPSEQLRLSIVGDLARSIIDLCSIASGEEKDLLFDQFSDLWHVFYRVSVPVAVKRLFNPRNGMNLLYWYMLYAVRSDFDPSTFWGER